MKKALFSIMLFFCITKLLMADVILPSVFNHHMVLQRDLKIPVWGWANPGEKIEVSFAGQIVSAVADDKSKWQVWLMPLKANTKSQVLSVKGQNTIQLKDVLIGDVWICSGQSNMEWSVAGSDKATQNAAYKKDGEPNIRLFRVPNHIQSTQPLADVQGQWRRCSKNEIKYFSAVGLSFGLTLQEKLNVPIGLIDTSWGGTAIESWISPEGYQMINQPVVENPKQTKMLHDRFTQVEKVVDEWQRKVEFAAKSGQLIPSPNIPQFSNNGKGGIYNAMVAGLTPFGVKGAIWYQGESNRSRTFPDYFLKLKGLIQGWREKFTSEKLSFYLVQIAPFDYNRGKRSQNDLILCENIWRSQYKAADEIKDCDIIPTHDTINGNLKDIHPRDKLTVGKRLAAMALEKDYQQTITSTGPIYKNSETVGAQIKIDFSHIDQGLSTSDSKAPNTFEISADGVTFFPAQAKIIGNQVMVWNNQVSEPKHVRMGWSEVVIPNLMDKNGWPVRQFTTITK
jgi:sialate O-acetylesterase